MAVALLDDLQWTNSHGSKHFKDEIVSYEKCCRVGEKMLHGFVRSEIDNLTKNN